MLKAHVSNIIGHSGERVKNQFVVMTDDGMYFQSYNTVIAFRNLNGEVFLDRTNWDYSVTTGKYRNLFLHEDKKTTQKKIDSGEYMLVDLN